MLAMILGIFLLVVLSWIVGWNLNYVPESPENEERSDWGDNRKSCYHINTTHIRCGTQHNI